MKIISHRGNIDGKNPDAENQPNYILSAVSLGFDVEIDVWFKHGKFFLGHDEPQYETTIEFLSSIPAWCHAKNLDAFERMLNHDIHCFWHQQDFCTLTNRRIPWCYPGNWIRGGITVVLDSYHPDIVIPDGVLGVCTDDPVNWRNR
jgi:hypothetical protein